MLCPQSWDFVLAVLKEALPEEGIVPRCVFQMFFRLLFSCYLSLGCLPSWSHFGFYSSRTCQLLKLQILGTWCGGDMHWSSGGRSHCTGTDVSLTKKGSHARVQGHGIWRKQARQPVSEFTAFSRCLCTYVGGKGREMVPTSSFVLR